MSFSYYDKDNNIKRLNIEVGKQWSSYKEKDENSLMNSIFDAVDTNSDGKVDEEELNVLQKLLKIADSQIKKTKNNNIIENEELELIVNKIKNYELHDLKGNNAPNIKTINIPNDIDKLVNYSYLQAIPQQNGDNDKVVEINEYNVDYSNLSNIEKGKYIVDHWEEIYDDGGSITIIPVVNKIQESNQDGTIHWSEGINRIISKIQLVKGITQELLDFMNRVGEEQGFSVELLDRISNWIEDLSIVRADKKQIIPFSKIIPLKNDNLETIISNRADITCNEQGHAAQIKKGDSLSKRYSYILSEEDVIYGRTYLEGGNVLNTLTKNGEPAAIIGEESIKYTILAIIALEKDKSSDIFEYAKQVINNNSEEYLNKAKQYIAEELGIKEENVTYIPQFDFHIDMYYRPLNDGQIGVPDYKAGINILKGLIKDIETNNIQNDDLQNKKEEYLKLINKLKEMQTKTAEISKEAEEELTMQGYEIVKIPSFTDIDEGIPLAPSTVENPINYMNGICGTSAKTGDKFYITNTSGDETLDAYMEKYFKEVVGFDKVYFAPTKKYLEAKGGIDCLTKEF